jgi:ABC-type Zn uptake system ZnuABC Zn-binding protein ZnuA
VTRCLDVVERILNLSRGRDDECRSNDPRHNLSVQLLLTPRPVLLHHPVVRVGQQRELQLLLADELGEFLRWIGGDADDFKVCLGEDREIVAEVAGLGGAAGRHGRGIGVEQDRTPSEVLQGDLRTSAVVKGERGGPIAGGQRGHGDTLRGPYCQRFAIEHSWLYRRPVRNNFRNVLIGVGAGALVLTGCSSSGDETTAASESGDKLLVATTVSPITSIASRVGGDCVEIRGIVPEGTNSHTFEPAPSVAALLSDADVVFINGLKLEDPTLEMAQANMRDDAELVELGTVALPESEYIYDFSFPEEEGKPNPHLWTDPGFAIEYAAIIRDVLTERAPECADTFQANFESFEAQANELADAIRADQQTVPEGNLKLVTYHDAYAYFADNFGWEVVGALQPSDFSDPTPSEVVTLIEQINAEGVPTIFGSEVFPSDVLEEIANETGVRYEDSLRDDDLPGAPGEENHSWLGLMQYNFATMIEGLGGQAPNIRAVDITSPITDTADYPQ